MLKCSIQLRSGKLCGKPAQFRVQGTSVCKKCIKTVRVEVR